MDSIEPVRRLRQPVMTRLRSLTMLSDRRLEMTVGLTVATTIAPEEDVVAGGVMCLLEGFRWLVAAMLMRANCWSPLNLTM